MSLRHPRRPAATLLAVLTLAGHVFSSPIQAQAPGATVRVTTTAKLKQWITGRVGGESADSLTIMQQANRPQQGSPLHRSPPAPVTMTADTLWLARADIHLMQVSQGRKSNAGRGALIGSGVGLGLGLVLFTVAMTSSDCDGGEGLCAAGAGVYGAGLALIGAGVGALIGSTSHRER